MYLSPRDGSMTALGAGIPGLSMGDNLGDEALGNASATGSPMGYGWTGGEDDVTRTIPPVPNGGNAGPSAGWSSGMLSSMFSPLFTALGSLFSQMSQMFSGSGDASGGTPNLGNCTQQPSEPQCEQQPFFGAKTGNGEQTFQNATASSTGDPHLAFNGTASNGSSVSDRWDNMNGHRDLLDSSSFRGGYEISTQATQPNASGVTYNRSATVTTDGGNVAVSLDAGGNATLSRNGNVTSMHDGQSIDLGGGESVTRNADGSLAIDDRNRQGGSITTTLRDNGSGVDVTAQAKSVNLGGYMVNSAQGQRRTQPVETGTDAP